MIKTETSEQALKDMEKYFKQILIKALRKDQDILSIFRFLQVDLTDPDTVFDQCRAKIARLRRQEVRKALNISLFGAHNEL